MNELELKFRLDDAASLRWQQMFEAQGARRQRLRARYFDTEDSRLAAAGVALRLRLEGRRWVQTLKATGESTVHRLEHEVAVQAAPGDTPALDLARHAGTPALARLQQALGDAAPQALIERFATDVWRASLVIEGADGSRIEAALDLGHVHAGGRQAPIAELELEHLAGPLATLFDRAHDALGAGGLWLSSISKAEQGERLRRGSPSPALEAQAVTWPKQASGAVMLRALLLNTLAQVLPNLSVTAEGQADAEHIHQARVGLRRLRTLLRELATASPGFDTRWDATLGEAFSALGERRDHEAVAAAVRPLLETAGAPKTTWTLPPTADTTAAARAPALQQVLLQLLALAHADDSAVSALSAKALTALFAKRLSRLHRQVRRDGRAFDSLLLARQHRVRRRLKRLRYLSEFAQPLWRGDKAGAYAEALKPMQDALGQHTDCAVAAEHFRHDALTDPAAQFAAGFLLAHLETTARNAHLALRRMRKLKPFWDD